VSDPDASAARYRFGDVAPVGLLLGMPARQAAPIVAGILWLTLAVMAQVPLVGLPGPVLGVVLAFGRFRGVPLFEIAGPGLRMGFRRRRQWTRSPAASGESVVLPAALAGLELFDVPVPWLGASQRAAVIRDHRLDTVSVVLPCTGRGFSVASLAEQDMLVDAWGATLAPLARAKCAVARVTWQEWCRPIGVAGHRRFLDSIPDVDRTDPARTDYELLLATQEPFTIAHEVLLTLTIELRRVRARRGKSQTEAAIDVALDEAKMLSARLEAAHLRVGAPLDLGELIDAIRVRSDPGHTSTRRQPARRSLAAAARRVAGEWAPMAIESTWTHAHIDGSFHRSFVITHWPMLAVPADWMRPLLTDDTATRTVTLVLEPVSMAKASVDANRHLTSIEADHEQKERHGFRLTARERRRQSDVAARERELADGHPEFKFVGIVTVTAATEDALDDASADVEESAAKSLLDIRPLAARQEQGWVASLPLGRSVRNGAWS
jgi:hypothetical protein